ncbi:hypothetical protein [Flavobacterium solisilvae]|uniref:Uncharacterized protein n=1 Tax=Flavobacterium solisilvae TaxID=1852019 RepID=A0ABX1QUS5_9FLAO|nr:hypothetical protein [Flavobacterium solisilvae]NMH24929.1 hypothetical protein [Flavobacterium solisilvae]
MTQEELSRELASKKKAFKNESRIEECFHHKKDECNGLIKQAHSIQRNGRLSILESDVNGNMCVYTFTSHKSTKERWLDDLVPIGKKEASTFFGFCDYHDTNLFSPIENFQFDKSLKHLFLHSYRSYAHSYHRKHEEYKIYNNPESEFVKSLPKDWVEILKMGVEMGVKDLKFYKHQLDAALENEQYDFFKYLVYEKEGLYPFAVSSQISPTVSYKNKPMNNHLKPNEPYSQPILTFLPDRTTTFVILAIFPNDKNGEILLDELKELNAVELEKVITSLIIANCENTFFSPKVWNKLNQNQKRIFLDEYAINTETEKYKNVFFKSRINFFSDFFEINNL